MKAIYTLLLLSLLSMAGTVNAGNVFTVNISSDTVIHPGKDQISKELLQLRDSINLTLTRINQKSPKSSSAERKLLTKADGELVLRRAEVEKVLEEVVITTERTWDENIRTRAIAAIREGRRDYYRILDDIKKMKLMTTDSSR